MDKFSHLVPVTDSLCVIKLDLLQCNYYKQSCIQIHSLDDEYMERINYKIQQQIQEEQTTQLKEQIFTAVTLR